MQGFLNLNKPAQLTSHDCVARVRRLLHLKRVGHGGTLDPAATGVLPIALGKATRLLQFLPSAKAYRATIRFGVQTTTDDLDGDVLTIAPAADLTLDQITAQLWQFQGKIQQIPPHYSAIQVGGKRLYDLARAGTPIDAPLRTVEVQGIDILAWRPGDYPELEVAIACGAGTYIRSIARDLGHVLQTGGTLAALLRTESSGFSIAESLSFEEVAHQIETQTFAPIPPNRALRHLRAIGLPPELVRRWQHGQRLRWSDVASEHLSKTATSALYQVQSNSGQFLGIGKYGQSDELVPRLVWE